MVMVELMQIKKNKKNKLVSEEPKPAKINEKKVY